MVDNWIGGVDLFSRNNFERSSTIDDRSPKRDLPFDGLNCINLKHLNLPPFMRTFLLIGCLILYSLHWSCSKSSDNFNISYNSIYHKTGVGPSTGLRLFTSKGEIKDPEILKQYNTSDNNLFLFYSGNFVQSSDFMDSIEFTDSRHARLYHNNQWIKNEVANQ